MATSMDDHASNILFNFSQCFDSPEVFAEPQLSKINDLQRMTKELYDFVHTTKSLRNFQTNSLSKLLIDGFDEEQIWQQIELLNKSSLPHFSKSISNLNVENIDLHPEVDNSSTNQNKNSDSESLEENDEYVFDDDSYSSDNASGISKDYEFDDDSDSDVQISNRREENYASESDTEHDKSEDKAKSSKRLFYKKSKVDDQFFKLSQLEDFLRTEDIKAERIDEVASDDEGIDLFQDIPSDEFDDTDDQIADAEKVRTKDFMYEDFFDAPESGDESISENQVENNETTKNNLLLESVADEYESEDDLKNQPNEEDIVNAGKVLKTAFELKQETIKKKIEECEQNMLQPLPWHLTGEVAASNRPIDSLVHKETDFDCNAKQDLIVDNVLNERIESIIKAAIANMAFSDVERKIKPTEEVVKYKKELVISQKKSKKGLAEVYEEDYLKKQSKQAEEENPKHKEIKKLMDDLFPELQALFSHIPKPAVPEIKIVSNLPAITVEEVAPTSVSDVTLLAPEEIKKKTGLIKGKTERNVTDRKRERRKKKILQKLKQKRNEAKSTSDTPSSKSKKREKIEALKKLKQHRNIKIANVEPDGKIKSSRDFFSKLQDSVYSKSSNKEKSSKKRK